MKVNWPRLWKRHAPRPEPEFIYGEIVIWRTFWGTARCVYLAPGIVYHRVLPLDGIPGALASRSHDPVELAQGAELFHAEP